jgi:hypothetical protein
LSYGNTYGNLILIILLIGLSKELPWSKMAILALILFLICYIPLALFQDLPAVIQFPRFVLLVGLFGIVLFFLRTKIEWKFAVAFLPLMLLPELLRRDVAKDPSTLLVPDQKHSLVYNYYVMDRVVVYNYWTDQGQNSFVTNVRVKENTDTGIDVRENQIFCNGTQVTFTDDNKLRPALVDGHKIVYLSDKDRGLGFYTLRVIDLRGIYRFSPPT